MSFQYLWEKQGDRLNISCMMAHLPLSFLCLKFNNTCYIPNVKPMNTTKWISLPKAQCINLDKSPHQNRLNYSHPWNKGIRLNFLEYIFLFLKFCHFRIFFFFILYPRFFLDSQNKMQNSKSRTQSNVLTGLYPCLLCYFTRRLLKPTYF